MTSYSVIIYAKIIKTIKMQKSLYVSHSKRGADHYYLDASARYRCVFPCEEYNPAQDKHCIHFDQIDKIDLFQYKTIIFHRPNFSLKLKRILKSLAEQNIKAVADFDDLLFLPEHALKNPTYLSGKMTASYAKKSTKSYLCALKLFSFAQTSTEPLTQHLKVTHPTCMVETHYNKVPNRWVKLTPLEPAEKRFKNKIIRYFPGTSHHTTNLNPAIETLKLILKTNKEIQLEIIGDIHIPENAFPKTQFNQLPYVLYEELPKLIANSWITLSPLEGNEFNQCKSALKFWESACFGVPVISNKIPDMQRLECSALLLSDNHEDWLTYINQLKNLDNYIKVSESAHKKSKDCIYVDDSSNKHNYSKIHLLMSAKFGPTWPAIQYNPTHHQHNSCLELLQQINNKENFNDITQKTIEQLTAEATILSEELFSLDYKNKKYKKLKKLKNNPKLFFTDMIKNMKR